MLKWEQISTLSFFRVYGAEKTANQKNFDEMLLFCQMVFDEKRRFHTKQDLYCQNKAIKTNFSSKISVFQCNYMCNKNASSFEC